MHNVYCTAPCPIAIQEARKVCNSELTKYKDMCSTMSKRVRSIHIHVHGCMWLHALRCDSCIIESCRCMCFMSAAWGLLLYVKLMDIVTTFNTVYTCTCREFYIARHLYEHICMQMCVLHVDHSSFLH